MGTKLGSVYFDVKGNKGDLVRFAFSYTRVCRTLFLHLLRERSRASAHATSLQRGEILADPGSSQNHRLSLILSSQRFTRKHQYLVLKKENRTGYFTGL